MLLTNLNGNILPQSPAGLDQFSRGFFYADGLFETIRVFDGRLPFLENHLRRLFAGMDALRFDRPAAWSARFFEAEILNIAPPNARVRLSIWRETGGRFLPENQQPNFLIQVEQIPFPMFSLLENGLKMGVCTNVALPCDAFSNFKTLNSARYVAAAIEAREQECDDVFIPNQHGRVCETTIANVFLIQENKLATPSLSEGCVAGTMRETVLALAAKSGFSVEEKPVTFAALLRADEIFLTNAVRGIVPVRAFQGKNFNFIKTKRLFRLLHALVSSAAQ